MTEPAKQTLLILGASGDLTARLLLPGLGMLLAAHETEELLLVGSGMEDWNDDKWQQTIRDSFAEAGATGELVDSVAASAIYLQADVTDGTDLKKLFDPRSAFVCAGS